MDSDRRKHKRLPLKFTVLCQKVGLSDGRLYSGNTVNVSPGGMLVEVNNAKLRDGELVSVEMTVPAYRRSARVRRKFFQLRPRRPCRAFRLYGTPVKFPGQLGRH